MHWDKLRYLEPPEFVTHEQWWLVAKLARFNLYKSLPFVDKYQNPFLLAMPDILWQKISFIDHQVGNSIIAKATGLFNNHMRDSYLVQSLTEEAITSSQLEGASTTREVAKEMLRNQRKPRDLNEQMIFNNYKAKQFILDVKNESLTRDIIFEIHRILTEKTLEESSVGVLRAEPDDIKVVDNRSNTILHIPAKANELEERLEKLCCFANQDNFQEGNFLPAVIKAILLHFFLAYDHPFVDGNGLTARALFYWSMANQGYDLMEFVSISSIIKQAPAKYAQAFLYTETDENDVTYFVLHQLNVILKAIHALYEHIEKKNKEIDKVERVLRLSKTLHGKLNHRQIALIKHALKHPKMHYRIDAHQHSHNITYETARTDLLALAEIGLLIKEKIGKAFIFIAPEGLDRKITQHSS